MPWSAMPSGMHNMLSKYKYNEYTFKKEGNNDYKKVAETLQVEIGRAIEPGKVGPDGGSHEENAIRTHIKDTLNVEYTYVIEAANSTDYGQQLSLAIAGEELPDIFTIYDRNTLDELVENELVADLTEIYEDYEIGRAHV